MSSKLYGNPLFSLSSSSSKRALKKIPLWQAYEEYMQVPKEDLISYLEGLGIQTSRKSLATLQLLCLLTKYHERFDQEAQYIHFTLSSLRSHIMKIVPDFVPKHVDLSRNQWIILALLQDLYHGLPRRATKTCRQYFEEVVQLLDKKL